MKSGAYVGPIETHPAREENYAEAWDWHPTENGLVPVRPVEEASD